MKVLLQSSYETIRLDAVDAFQENENTVFIKGEINDELAFEVISTLKYLSDKDHEKPITLMINSTGGSISAGLAIYDYASSLPNPINTTGIGICASMGAFLLTCTGKKRSAYPNTVILYHQPLTTGFSGSVNDVLIHTQHLQFLQKKTNQLLADHSKLSEQEIETMFGRDCFLTPEKCVEYGLIDEIL